MDSSSAFSSRAVSPPSHKDLRPLVYIKLFTLLLHIYDMVKQTLPQTMLASSPLLRKLPTLFSA